MSRVRARVVVSGRVQGVFFRYTMAQEAQRRQVKGWAKNCRDGTVEAVLEGEKEKIEGLISWCRQGPPGAVVRKVEVEWQECPGEFASFFIKG